MTENTKNVVNLLEKALETENWSCVEEAIEILLLDDNELELTDYDEEIF